LSLKPDPLERLDRPSVEPEEFDPIPRLRIRKEGRKSVEEDDAHLRLEAEIELNKLCRFYRSG
jgi:hypothetical protein